MFFHFFLKLYSRNWLHVNLLTFFPLPKVLCLPDFQLSLSVELTIWEMPRVLSKIISPCINSFPILLPLGKSSFVNWIPSYLIIFWLFLRPKTYLFTLPFKISFLPYSRPLMSLSLIGTFPFDLVILKLACICSPIFINHFPFSFFFPVHKSTFIKIDTIMNRLSSSPMGLALFPLSIIGIHHFSEISSLFQKNSLSFNQIIYYSSLEICAIFEDKNTIVVICSFCIEKSIVITAIGHF